MYLYLRVVILSLFLLLGGNCFGQANIINYPKDLQLYPRNESSQCSAEIQANLSPNVIKVSVLVKKNGVLSNYHAQTFSSANNNVFTYQATLDAELSEYTLETYTFTSNSDSSLVKKSTKVLCGDVFLIYGQSNCLGYIGLDTLYTNQDYFKFLRNVDNPYQSDITTSLHWYEGYNPYASLGVFGLKIGQNLIKKFGFPILLINGAEGGASINYLMNRNPTNIADVNTQYGKLIYKTNWANCREKVKGIIWRQGENESGYLPAAQAYEGKLQQLMSYFQTDFSSLEKIYVVQNNIITTTDGYNDSGSIVREAQRKSNQWSPKITAIASVGVQIGYDGLHYDYNGHAYLANQITDKMGVDFYGKPSNENLNFPDLKKIYFKDLTKKEIVIEFSENQQLVADSIKNGLKLKDFFYTADNQLIDHVEAQQNKLILTFFAPTSTNYITYLPSFFTTTTSHYIYDGPLVKNQLDRAAFSFYQRPVANSLPAIQNLVCKIKSKQIYLDWSLYPIANKVLMIRKRKNGVVVKTINLTTSAIQWIDDEIDWEVNATYQYELWVEDTFATSPIAVIEKNICPTSSTSAVVNACSDCQYFYDAAIQITNAITQNQQEVYSSKSITLSAGTLVPKGTTFTVSPAQCEN